MHRKVMHTDPDIKRHQMAEAEGGMIEVAREIFYSSSV
jgi:hypothetical protein